MAEQKQPSEHGQAAEQSHMIDITDDPHLWSRCYTVHSLVIIGTKEKDANYNMAPKHLAMPMGFGPYFGFIGTPKKATYQNVQREKSFTVSYPRPGQLTLSSLMASQREEDDSKPVVEEIPTVEARQVAGKFLKDSYLQLECRLHQTFGNFNGWEMVVGEVVAAHAHEDALRKADEDLESDHLVKDAPLLAYLYPDRFSIVQDSHSFPFPKDFKR